MVGRVIFLQFFEADVVELGDEFDGVGGFLVDYFYGTLDDEVNAGKLLPFPIHSSIERIIFKNAFTQNRKPVRNTQLLQHRNLNVKHIP